MKSLVVESDKIRKNIEIIRDKAKGVPIIGVLKGNGYGLGLIELAKLIREEGVSRFAVTEPSDALRLRDAGFADEEILILRSTAIESEIKMIIESCAVATIGSYDAAVALSGVAEKDGTIIDAHIEIDTGMGRYGFLPSELDRILSVYRYMKNITVTGLYTHFYSAFASKKATFRQADALSLVAGKIRDAGYDPGILHAANSSGLFAFPDLPLFDAVRIGSAFTGRMPLKDKGGLSRVGYLESQIIEVRWLLKGQTIGYGGGFTTKRPMRIAVVPIGYGDGYMTEKSRDIYRLRDVCRYLASDVKKAMTGNKFYAFVGGKRARVLGHVGLAHTIIDVTDIDCATGDSVTFDVSPLYVPPQIERRYV